MINTKWYIRVSNIKDLYTANDSYAAPFDTSNTMNFESYSQAKYYRDMYQLGCTWSNISIVERDYND